MPEKRWIIEALGLEYEKHFQECKKNNMPFIRARINPETKNYLVNLDLVTCDYTLSADRQKTLEEIFLSESKTSKFKGYRVDSQLSFFDGVESSRLESFLEKLYKISTP